MSRPVNVEGFRPLDNGVSAQVVPVDTVGRVAAGGLLLSIAIVELVLGFWAAGWHHRAVALSVACIGAAFLASGITEIAVALGRSSPRSTEGRGVSSV